MKLYLAGNNGIEREHRTHLYNNFFERRLFSYFEVLPGRFARPQFQWVLGELIKMELYLAGTNKSRGVKDVEKLLFSYFELLGYHNFGADKFFEELMEMKLYLAGTTVASAEEIGLQELFKDSHKLHSYFHCKEGFETKWFDVNLKNKVDIFLDSGAFSAFTKGVKIDIEEYANFVRPIEKYLAAYANLDVIGSADATWDNQKQLESLGMNPVPCFHYGEDLKWLKRYMDNYEYVALGGMVPISTPALIVWLDNLFSKHICDEKGMPRIKVHGFGMTSLPLMLRYPWYSVDSTSWVVTGRLGGINVPRFRGGKYIYDEQSWKINVSNKSPSLTEAGEHITTVTPGIRAALMRYIEEKGYVMGESTYRNEAATYELKDGERWCGKAQGDVRNVETVVIPGISNEYKLRDEMNIIYWLDLEKSIQPWPWSFSSTARGGGEGFGL